jgi:hypothetical protein
MILLIFCLWLLAFGSDEMLEHHHREIKKINMLALMGEFLLDNFMRTLFYYALKEKVGDVRHYRG